MLVCRRRRPPHSHLRHHRHGNPRTRSAGKMRLRAATGAHACAEWTVAPGQLHRTLWAFPCRACGLNHLQSRLIPRTRAACVRRCKATHPGQADYTADSGAAFATDHSGDWGLDSKHGWRFCGLTLERCMEACVAMGGCAELSVALNGCCFPAKSTCDGQARSRDTKYQTAACDSSGPSPPPPAPSPPTACWENAPAGSHWCARLC